MNKDNYSRKNKIKINGSTTHASTGGGRSPETSDEVSTDLRKSAPRFVKLKPLGANIMATGQMTIHQYRVFFLLLRDVGYGGRCYTHPSIVGKELGIDVANVRCAIRGLESKQMVFKQIMKNKGHCYFLNPSYVSVGSDEEESAAQASWNIERIKRIKSIERV